MTRISKSILQHTTNQDGRLLAHGVDVTGAREVKASSVIGLYGPALRILRDGADTSYVYHGRTIAKTSKDGCSPRWNGHFVRLADAVRDADTRTTRATVLKAGIVGQPVSATTAWAFAQAAGYDSATVRSAIDFWADRGDLPNTYPNLHRLLADLVSPKTVHRYAAIGARGRAAAAAKRDRGRG